MLRIAQCSDSFFPVSDGVSRVVNAYARELSARGHEVYVITPLVTQGYRGRLNYEILDYVALNLGGGQMKATAAMLDMHYLARVGAHSFDIVHAHSPGSAGMEAWLFPVRKGSKMSFSLPVSMKKHACPKNVYFMMNPPCKINRVEI